MRQEGVFKAGKRVGKPRYKLVPEGLVRRRMYHVSLSVNFFEAALLRDSAGVTPDPFFCHRFVLSTGFLWGKLGP